MNEKTVAQVVVDTLKEIGVKHVFGVPSGAWVEYMEAIRNTEGIDFILHSITVERQRSSLDRVHGEQRNELLGILIGAVVIARPRDDDGQAMRDLIGLGQVISCRLARAVGITWLERCHLIHRSGHDLAIDLVGGDMQEALYLVPARGLE